MRKFEFNGKLPKKINGADIIFHKDEKRCFVEESHIGYEIQGNCINLPYFRHNAEFFFLQNKTQFIFYVPEYIERICATDVTRTASCWFGGKDDDGIFLVRLNDKPYKAYNHGDEEAFLASLKPDVIKVAEEKFKIKCSEQLGMFVVSLPFTLKDLDKVGILFKIPKKSTYERIFEEITVFGNMKGYVSNGLPGQYIVPGQQSVEYNKLYLLAGIAHRIENRG